MVKAKSENLRKQKEYKNIRFRVNFITAVIIFKESFCCIFFSLKNESTEFIQLCYLTFFTQQIVTFFHVNKYTSITSI